MKKAELGLLAEFEPNDHHLYYSVPAVGRSGGRVRVNTICRWHRAKAREEMSTETTAMFNKAHTNAHSHDEIETHRRTEIERGRYTRDGEM